MKWRNEKATAMLVFMVCLFSTATAFAASPSSNNSDKYDHSSSNLSHCIETFYDRNEYNWLAIRNKCSEAISVTSICRTCGEHLGGSGSIKPGGTASTGLSEKEVSQKGGLSFAVCRDGFFAVGDTNGGAWKPDTPYYCYRK